MLALCDFVITQDVRHLDTLTQIDAWLLELARPEIFDDGDARNVVMNTRRGFGQLVVALAEHNYPNAGQMTTYDFQQAINYLNQKHKRD